MRPKSLELMNKKKCAQNDVSGLTGELARPMSLKFMRGGSRVWQLHRCIMRHLLQALGGGELVIRSAIVGYSRKRNFL